MKVVIAGGGTAGHVNPAIALAHALVGHDVAFIGTERGVESTLVPDEGFELRTIDVVGFDRSKPTTIVKTGMRALAAVDQTRKILSEIDPDVVVGMGGYVSLPAAFAAKSRRLPLVLHEQNIVLGLAHKVSKPLAARVAVSFEDTLRETGKKGVYTGNPVKSQLTRLDQPEARRAGFRTFDLDPQRKTLLVFGGSLGAKRINLAASGLRTLWADRGDLQILHITGRAQFEALRDMPAGPTRHLIYRLLPYAAEMGEAYAVADLALCRGGATTVAELGVLGTPSIIVPYPFHRDKQQERHGKMLEAAGAAVVLADADTSASSVASVAEGLFSDEERLAGMKVKARSLGRPDAADRLAGLVLQAAR
ncbi:MAG: undecaprenyldiphospho-muramoylpentapeptide beta-N-acetylglucosaminyltransferase [Actinomycetota bacterium]